MRYENKRWLLLAASMMMNICIGSGYAWSVFQKPLMQMYGWSAAEASMAFTLVMGLSAIPMALVGKIQDYIQPRWIIFAGGLIFGMGIFATGYVQSLGQLYLFYGTLAGFGTGIVYSGGVANMVRFFPDRRGLCSGLLAAGMGSGAIIIAPAAAYLIESYGVLTAFKVLGGIFCLIICSLSLFIDTAPVNFKPQNWQPDNSNAAINSIDKNWKEMLRDPVFYIIAGMFMTGTVSGLMIIGQGSPILQEVVKLTPQEAAALVGILALANAAGRVFWGWISDRLGRFQTCFVLYILAGSAMYGLTIVPRNYFFVTLMMLVGLCYGGFMSMVASLTADTFGIKNLPVNFGIMFLAFGIAAYIGPRLAAVIKVANQGDYSQAFLVASILCAAGIILTVTAMYLKGRALKRQPEWIG